MDRELIAYLPGLMQDYEEMKQIMQAEQPCVEALWEACDMLMKEAFLDTETETGAEVWERILEITPKDTDSLELRNFRIKGRLNEDLPYTDRTLERQLLALCGENRYTKELTSENGLTMKIRVALVARELKAEVIALADRIVPAQIVLDIELMYNINSALKRATYRQLKKFTHLQIKEIVLEGI